MKLKGDLSIWAMMVVFLTLAVFPKIATTQSVIQLKDYPTEVGTFFITEDDIESSIPVDVGEPGMNKVWRLEQPLNGKLHRQIIVEKNAGFFSDEFAEANVVTRYVGNIGELIHTWYFDEVPGEMYIYQKIDDQKVSIQGLGIRGPIYKGTVKNSPEILLHHFPLKYGDTWQSTSAFSIEVDTVLFGSQTTIRADIADEFEYFVDGVGTLLLPLAQFKCLRLKSYITSSEKIFLDGRLISSKDYRTINYTWVAKNFGTIARVLSHCNEPNDNYTRAKQISRLHMFNPKIYLGFLPLRCAPGDFLTIPLTITDLTDLDVTQIQLKLSYDPGLLTFTGVQTIASLSEAWGDPIITTTPGKIDLTFEGEIPLAGKGNICFLRFQVNPVVRRLTNTEIALNQAAVTEIGPEIVTRACKIVIKPAINDPFPLGSQPGVPTEFALNANYPNPFNPETRIAFDLPGSASVTLGIYDARGRLVKIVLNENLNAGRHAATWLGRDESGEMVASGVYFYRIEAKPNEETRPVFLETRKMILMK